MELTTVTLFLFFISMCLFFCKSPSKTPPGPKGWPLVGHLDKFIRCPDDLHATLTRWSKDYGNFYSLKVGPKLVYVVNGYDEIFKCFTHPSVQGRTPFKSFIKAIGKGAGLATASGEAWSVQRKFFLVHAGLKKNKLGGRISEEASRLLKKLAEYEGGFADVGHHLTRAHLNIVCYFCFGSNYDYSDPEFKRICQSFDFIMDNPGPMGMNYSSAALTSVPYSSGSELVQNIQWMGDFTRNVIRRQMDQETGDDSLIHEYITRMNGVKHDGSGGSHFVTENLVWTVIETFFGACILNYNLCALIQFLACRTDVQIKCRKEIDNFLISEKDICYSKRDSFPYLQATVSEVFRVLSATPLGVGHIVTETLSLHDYVIPLGSGVVGNLHGVMYDEQTFPNPEEFRPERFIDANDGTFKRPKQVCPFGIGNRSCVGEQWGWMEVFLMAANLLRCYNFSSEVTGSYPQIVTGPAGVDRRVTPMNIKIRKRSCRQLEEAAEND